MRLPNFFIIGAAKCGTTSLAYYLNQHPEIYIPKDKETHFFDDDILFEKGIDLYTNFFYLNASKYPARGDATPAYLHYYEKVIPRIQKHIPPKNQKFIAILRDPVTRAFSHYQDNIKTKNETLSFIEALKAEKNRLSVNPYRWQGYFNDGRYAHQLKKWFHAFGKDSFLIIFQHRFAIDPQAHLRKIFEFLKVDTSFKVPDLSRKNEAGIPRWDYLMRLLSTPSFFSKRYSKVISSHRRRRIRKKIVSINTKTVLGKKLQSDRLSTELRKLYEDDIRELERMLEVNLTEWYNN